MTDTATKTSAEQKRAKHGRSPAYPGITLKTAIEKAKALYDAEGKYAAPMPSAFKAWGFGEKSSGGRETRAALRYFGLINIEGDGETGKVKLTDDAFKVLLDEREDQTEKKAIISRLALTPAIHKKLAEKFSDGIKSDGTVEHFLVFEEGYNKQAASELVAEFKETATYAELFQPAIVVDKHEEDNPLENIVRVLTPSEMAQNSLLQSPGQRVKIMEGERVVFIEEGKPSQYLKLVASGDLDDVLLEALDDFVKRQRKRLGVPVSPAKSN